MRGSGQLVVMGGTSIKNLNIKKVTIVHIDLTFRDDGISASSYSKI